MPAYQLYMNLDLLATVQKSGNQRKAIIEFLHRLCREPNLGGEITDRDSTDRTRQIKAIGTYAITYWVDQPAKMVMVVDLRPALK